ncbi:hypothetical protein ACFL5Z_02975 [Planctomycetota bacterium]
MSDPEKQNDDQGSEKSLPPTASFDSLVLGPGIRTGQFRIEREPGCNTVVAYWIRGSLKTF